MVHTHCWRPAKKDLKSWLRLALLLLILIYKRTIGKGLCPGKTYESTSWTKCASLSLNSQDGKHHCSKMSVGKISISKTSEELSAFEEGTTSTHFETCQPKNTFFLTRSYFNEIKDHLTKRFYTVLDMLPEASTLLLCSECFGCNLPLRVTSWVVACWEIKDGETRHSTTESEFMCPIH